MLLFVGIEEGLEDAANHHFMKDRSVVKTVAGKVNIHSSVEEFLYGFNIHVPDRGEKRGLVRTQVRGIFVQAVGDTGESGER